MSVKEVEDAIYAVEGFRVRFEPLEGTSPKKLAPYDFREMAPQKWRLSDWKNTRLAAYRSVFRGVSVLRGDGRPVGRDLQLGNVRDSYYSAAHGTLEPPEPATVAADVISLAARRR